MSSPTSTTAFRVRLPEPPSRPRPPAVPVATVSGGAVASGALGFVAGVAPPGVLACTVVTVVAGLVGWALDRLVGTTLAERREKSRFSRALDEVEQAVDRLRTTRARELADWYPTADRVGVSGAAGRAARALVLGVGRASSGVVLDGRPEDGLAPDDPAVARLARLRAEAAVLDEAPLCVPLGSTVRVVGPPVVAEAVASGLRRQLRAAGAPRAEADAVIDCVLVDRQPSARGAPGPGTRARASPDADADADADANAAVETAAVETAAVETAAVETAAVDTVVVIGHDGVATVTRKDGRPCRQTLRVAFVSVRDELWSRG